MSKELTVLRPGISEIVILDRGNSLWTTSLNIAEKFGKRHDNVLRDIQKLECSPEFGLLNFEESSYQNDQDKTQPMYLISRDGFVFLAMGFRGKKAAQWKEAYISAFNAMEKRILQIASERERRAKREWQEARYITKEQRKELTDTIRDILIPHARSQGSTAHESKHYLSYSRMIKSGLFSDPRNLSKDYRDLLTIKQLNILAVAESIVEDVIREEAAKGTPYKGPDGIFEKAKARIIQYAATVGVLQLGEPERLSLVRRTSGALGA